MNAIASNINIGMAVKKGRDKLRTGKERRLDMQSHHDKMERDKQDDKAVARFKRKPYSVRGDTGGQAKIKSISSTSERDS